ncbi:hypothetical protein Trydic_g18940 [Trypoxylus dichotomus]
MRNSQSTQMLHLASWGLRKVKESCWKEQESIKILCYDNDAILTDNEDDLQRLLYRFQSKTESLNMQISTEKAEPMVIAKEPI